MKNDLKFGILHAFIALPATLVVSNVMGIPITTMLLFAGIFTLIFHIITKNKIPSVLSISGSYISAILVVTATYGKEYVGFGVIGAGVIYFILGFLSTKIKDFHLYFPKWLLMLGVGLIAMSLIPIGVDLATQDQLICLITLAVMFLAMFSNKKIFNLLPMGWALAAGTISSFIIRGIPTIEKTTALTINPINLKFNIGAFALICFVGIVTYFEMLADIQNTSVICNRDYFKELGINKISYGNGLCTMISGMFGYPPFTTYSENAAALLVTKYYNPNAQIITAIVFILAAFITPLFDLTLYIPMAAFGAVLIGLYSTLFINTTKEIMKSEDKNISIISIVWALSYMNFAIRGVVISSISIALFIGLIINGYIVKKQKKEKKNETTL